jgi:hypothetical protein
MTSKHWLLLNWSSLCLIIEEEKRDLSIIAAKRHKVAE